MKKSIFSLVFLASMSTIVSCKNEATVTTSDAIETVAPTEESSTYKLDLQNSVIDWKGSKPTGTHTGTINFSDGEAIVTDGKLTGGKFIFDMNSITVTDLKAGDGKEDLEAHLKGTGDKEGEDHFFNVGKFPEGMFEVTSITSENGKATVNGNLTLKGVTKPVSFPATVAYEGNNMTLTSDSFQINRTQWNVNYASKSIFDDLKDKFVNDEIELVVKLKATKQ